MWVWVRAVDDYSDDDDEGALDALAVVGVVPDYSALDGDSNYT